MQFADAIRVVHWSIRAGVALRVDHGRAAREWVVFILTWYREPS